MLIGLLIAVMISIFAISGAVFMSNFTGNLQNPITAAVIGNGNFVSYSLFSFILSAIFLLVLITISHRKNRLLWEEDTELYRR